MGGVSAEPVAGVRVGHVLARASAGGEVCAALFSGVGAGMVRPFAAVDRARCACPVEHADVPARSGACGFYLHASERRLAMDLATYRCAPRLRVELFGRVLEHGDDNTVEGWRAERIRVLSVSLPAHCEACHDERTGVRRVATVPVGRSGRVRVMCEVCALTSGSGSVPVTLAVLAGALSTEVCFEGPGLVGQLGQGRSLLGLDEARPATRRLCGQLAELADASVALLDLVTALDGDRPGS